MARNGFKRNLSANTVGLMADDVEAITLSPTAVAINLPLSSESGLLSSSPSLGIGYATGAGGAVTQITSRATGVTMVPNPCLSGTITTHNASLAAEASAEFVVTNSAVAIGDVVAVSIQSGAVGVGTIVSVSTVTDGSFTIRVHNGNVASGTAETGAIKINFVVLKAVSA